MHLIWRLPSSTHSQGFWERASWLGTRNTAGHKEGEHQGLEGMYHLYGQGMDPCMGTFPSIYPSLLDTPGHVVHVWSDTCFLPFSNTLICPGFKGAALFALVPQLGIVRRRELGCLLPSGASRIQCASISPFPPLPWHHRAP